MRFSFSAQSTSTARATSVPASTTLTTTGSASTAPATTRATARVPEPQLSHRLLALIVLLTLFVSAGITWALLRAHSQRISPAVKGAVVKQLEVVRVIEERPTIVGYDRKHFGGWAGPATCDTRAKVLAQWFGASSCSLADAAPITDPYGGGVVEVHEVDVDHVFPLAAAWDLGASNWQPQQRREFANDIDTNLIPTRSSQNREKSDLTPGEWMPQAEMQCAYAQKYLEVAVKWELSITVADWRALARACDVD